jgi:hypothetical protein
MNRSGGNDRRRNAASYSLRSLLLSLTLCGVLFAFTVVLQERWTLFFCCWGACLIGQSMLAAAVWKQRRRAPEGIRSWRRKTANALVAIGVCIPICIYILTFLESLRTRLQYGEQNLEWLMGLAVLSWIAVAVELSILVVCALIARQRPILFLQVANPASAIFPFAYFLLVPVQG